MRLDLLGTALAACLLLASIPRVATAQGTPASAAEVARGKYLFGATGGCGCHTVPKGQINAGGRRYDGPFGTVYSSNITPDKQTGIGAWTDDQIMTAIRSGRRPNARRQGIARSLLSSVLDNARARAFKIVVLEVRPSNHHALTLYESFGFRVVGRRHGYYYDTGEDALVMEIALTGQSTPRGNQAAR